MPRQIDLFPQNLQVNHDPTEQLGVTQGQLDTLQGQIPAALEKASIAFINSVLAAIDQATGWDLLSFAQQVESGLNITGNLATDLWNYIFGAGTNATNSINNWTTLLEELGLPDQTATALVTWLNGVYTNALNAWNNWVTTLENLGKTTVTDFTDFINAIDSNASDAAANWTTVLEDVGIPAPTATAFVSWLQELLNPNSPLNASNLWGLIPSTSVTAVPAAAVTASTVNPLFNPNFQGAISISPGSGWVWDSTVYYTPPSGDTAPGSAKVVANGNLHALRSNLINLDANQTLTISLPILSSGLTVTGSPLELDIVTYNNSAQTGITPLTTMGAPTGATTGWTNPPSGAKGGTISGTYTCPSSGVTQVQLRLAVDTGASAGTVWWGNTTASISGGVISTIQSDLSSLSADSAASTAALSTLFSSWESAISGYTSWTSFIAAMESAWQTYVTTETTLSTGAFATIQQLINSLLGINTSTGQMAASNVSNMLGGASLGADVQAILDYIANALGHSGTGHTLTQIETYLGLIPPTNVTNVLGGSSLGADVQAILDYIANALGHSGTGHTLTQIETYLGIIPAANVTNVLGGANLGADVSSVNTTSSNMNTWWSQLLTELGITPGGSNGTNVGSTISTASTNASSAVSTATSAQSASTTNSTNINNTWSWLFGTTSPTSSSTVQNTKVANVLGGSSLGADLTTLATQLFGSATVNNITTIEQDIVNFVGNAISGGNAATSTNSPAASIYSALMNIPHTNVLVPPNPGSGSITHDANAHPSSQYSGTTGLETLTWNHTCGANANYFVVRVAFYTTQSATVSVSYDGVAMQLLQSVAFGNSTAQIYGLANPVTGSAQQVSVTVWTPTGSYVDAVVAESDSYNGVGSVGAASTNTGSGTSLSQTVTSATGDYIVQSFMEVATGATLASYNQTQQFNSYVAVGASNLVLLAGDAAGASSVSFTATASTSGFSQWAAAAVNLIPAPTNVLGSGFRAANTSTSNVSCYSGSAVFPNGFFNTVETGLPTPDLTYNSTTNTVTITHAGWYTVTIAVLMYSGYYNQSLGLNLTQNFAAGGSAVKRGNTTYIGTGLNSNLVVAHTFQLYCNDGDGLVPGYYATTAGTAFTATTDGLSTYFEVSLNNRSLA